MMKIKFNSKNFITHRSTRSKLELSAHRRYATNAKMRIYVDSIVTVYDTDVGVRSTKWF